MSGETVLVVGGAGYIGSYTCLDLANKGFKPVVYDNFNGTASSLSETGSGRRRRYQGLRAQPRRGSGHASPQPSRTSRPDRGGGSVKDPVTFYENTAIGTPTLLAAAQAAGIKAFVFSSAPSDLWLAGSRACRWMKPTARCRSTPTAR